MKNTFKPLLIVSLLSVLPLGYADTIINWGSTNYVTSSSSLYLPSPSDSGTTRTWVYSDTTALTPVSGYSGPDIYGALQLSISSGPKNFTQAQVVENAAGDRLTFSTPSDIGNMTAFIFFEKQSFASGAADNESVYFDTGSSFSINLNQNGGGTSLRAAVLNNGMWYLSATTFTGTGVKTIADLSTEMWAAWDPTTELSTAPTTYSISGSTLTDIEAVGFRAYNVRSSANLLTFATDSIVFSAAVAVPEPATFAALLSIGILGFAVTRRRH